MSIIYNKSDFLRKDLPTTAMSENYMGLLFVNISEYVNNNSDDVNNINNNMLSILDQTASIYKNTMRTLGNITNNATDVFITGGGSRDSINIFDKEINITENGVMIDYDTMQIYLGRNLLYANTIKKISIDTKNGSLGNTIENKKKYFNIDNIVSLSSRLEIESYESALNINIDIDLGQKIPFNNTRFNLTNFGTRLPIIGSISTSDDGCNFKKIKINTSNSFSMDVNLFNFEDGQIKIHTEEISTRFIRINLLQEVPYSTGSTKRKRYAIGINGLETGFYSAKSSGDIIVGPIKSSSEIFKVSAYGSMIKYNLNEPNVKLYISTDLSTWIPFQNSAIYDPESELSKIINFNNIDKSSVFTEESVNKIYLKIEMSSVDVSYISPVYVNITRKIINASSASRNFFIEPIENKNYVSIFKNTDLVYGSRVSIPPSAGDTYSTPSSNISFVESEGRSIIQGLGIESDEIYDISKDSLSNRSKSIAIQFKHDKLHVTRNDIIENVPTDDYDPFSISIYGFSSVLDDEIQIETHNNEFSQEGMMPIIPFMDNAGVYTLRFGTKHINIKYGNGYFLDNRETLYAVPEGIDHVLVENEIGDRIANIDVIDINGTNYISILDALGLSELMENNNPNGIKFNKFYPLTDLQKDEYAIYFGKMVFGDFYKGNFSVAKIFKSQINTRVEQVVDGIRLVSTSSKQIKSSYKLNDYDLRNIIKLKHTNILEQSVVFDLTKASINAFLVEVDFINGQNEFILSDSYVQLDNINKNIIKLHSEYLEDGAIEFKSCNEILSRRVYAESELSDIGDYFINNKTIPNQIELPEDIYTSSSNDTEIKYNIKPTKKSVSGFYSIDYERGILYSTSDIDGKTSISYRYSSVYGEYTSLYKLKEDEYSISGSNLTINTEDEKTSKYLLVSSGIEKSEVEYMETPMLSDFSLNIIDASNSI